VDHNLQFPDDDGTDGNASDDATSLFEGSLINLMLLMIIPAIVLIIVVFIIIRAKKSKKSVSVEADERTRFEQEEQAKKEEFKSLYSDDLSLQPRASRPQVGAPVRVDYIGPGGPPPEPSFSPTPQLPMGPLPSLSDQPTPLGKKKKVPKGDDYSVSQFPTQDRPESQQPGKFNIHLPGDADTGEQSFQTIAPERTDDVEFKSKGPLFADSAPIEWESATSNEYEKTFEFGSGPETVDGKKKKQND
jgi:hypothetical protein